jgi:UPF0755 protein
MEKPDVPKRAKRPWLFWRVIVLLYAYFWVLLALGVACTALFSFLVYEHVVQPGIPGPPQAFTVPQGVTGTRVGELLAEAGLVEHDGFFRLALKLDTTKKSIKHGSYQLPKGLSALEFLHLLQDGPTMHAMTAQKKLTIPEGLSLRQMADRFDDPESFMAAAKDAALVQRLALEVSSLEGFLLPETYLLDEDATPQDVVERMFNEFEAVYAELVASVPGAEELDPLTVVTVASMVEEEARMDEERAQVAAVLYNRLEMGMPLQMDSTLQYALGKYGERMLYADKKVDSPYNTYKYKGLPPGPISCPGRASLEAAMAPADVAYLYFVSNADGRSHTFSRTSKEHEQAVIKYRREIAKQRRAQQ